MSVIPLRSTENQQQFFAAGYSRVVLEQVGHFPAREDAQSVAEAILPALRLNTPIRRAASEPSTLQRV